MKILKQGHSYVADGFESPDGDQIINFIEKSPIEGTSNMQTVREGTTKEEVLKILIDRLSFLNQKFPCRENSIVITKLEESLMWLNKRTEDRKTRGVEGKHIK